MPAFHEVIRARRLEFGLTQEEVALRAGLAGQSTVGNYERGSRYPRWDEMTRLAGALEVPAWELLADELGFTPEQRQLVDLLGPRGTPRTHAVRKTRRAAD